MKPILIAVVLFMSTFTKSFAADNNIVEPTVLKSFQTTFAGASDVDWSMTEGLYKAVFLLNGQYISAYYNADGTMQAISRHINASSLPMLLQTGLKTDYKNLWVSDVMEVTNEGGLQYYVTLEDAGSKTILKATATTWSTFQKTRKD